MFRKLLSYLFFVKTRSVSLDFVATLNVTRQRSFHIHPHTLESMNNLVKFYESWNKPEEAEKWRAKLPQTETVEQ